MRFDQGFDITDFTRSAIAWQKVAMDYHRMWFSASQVIWHRSMQMALGTMTASEFTRMMTEKPTAFAQAAEKAILATVGSKGYPAIVSASMRPVSRRASANASRLGRTQR